MRNKTEIKNIPPENNYLLSCSACFFTSSSSISCTSSIVVVSRRVLSSSILALFFAKSPLISLSESCSKVFNCTQIDAQSSFTSLSVCCPTNDLHKSLRAFFLSSSSATVIISSFGSAPSACLISQISDIIICYLPP